MTVSHIEWPDEHKQHQFSQTKLLHQIKYITAHNKYIKNRQGQHKTQTQNRYTPLSICQFWFGTCTVHI